MLAIKAEAVEAGKHIAASKKVFTWDFELFEQKYLLTLTVSYNSKKYLVTLNKEIELYRSRRPNDKDSFKYEFYLDNELISITEKGKKADLTYNGRNFYNYISSALIHKTQQPQIKNSQIVILPKVGSPQESRIVAQQPAQPLQPPVPAPEKTPFDRVSPLSYPDPSAFFTNTLRNTRSTRMIRFTVQSPLEVVADNFEEVNFPDGSERAQYIIWAVHQTPAII